MLERTTARARKGVVVFQPKQSVVDRLAPFVGDGPLVRIARFALPLSALVVAFGFADVQAERPRGDADAAACLALLRVLRTEAQRSHQGAWGQLDATELAAFRRLFRP